MTHVDAAESVHPYVRKGAAWAWRLLVLLAFGLTALWLFWHLNTITIPVLLALMAAALLVPPVNFLERHKVPRSLAVVVVLLTGTAAIVGILTFVVDQFIKGLPDLSTQLTDSIESLKNWAIHSRFHISEDQIGKAGDALVNSIKNNQDKVTSGALATATTVTEIITGAVLTFFTVIFFLYGGREIWDFVTRIFPTSARPRVRRAGVLGFGSLIGYVRATVAVALVDALGIGVGLAAFSVPLALPLASLVFLGAFIPIIGAAISGFVAVFIALITKGAFTAAMILVIVIVVMQVEGHVLQPLIMGHAVRIHPLAVVFAIAAGGVLGGIIGALLAVPTVAVLNTAIRALLHPDDDDDPYVLEGEEEAEILDPEMVPNQGPAAVNAGPGNGVPELGPAPPKE
ncbi:AI-2E family transporter [Mycobacterium sp. CBMA271]|uniref:AI-2E family transporter n=1 Tax=unclassified Mycobacteroides TaxID=2618759 RepID=UPI0012DDCC4A|nr:MULTISPECIES: AI-2E family transporter [unclassified Mycobacteroides]MUM19112.1 AI-2E family transporter [Mycobacteroides sp. CBMA 326]MUM21526.1 AI-2E family transporter [Mycobacteroides sp. CBMA 271]